MDDNISENKLKTDGIYAWVRNPMYSGWWILMFGISMMWHNVFLLATPVINWVIMTIVLINTEEKWLLDLYGDQYKEYKKKVNRCIPIKR
ncbi:MAG: isoprenylcysteine carboxylmethyltransferase family protein [Lachnospiraceae bacterium]|nr:isoprenylcysteine carboxylmethyltransferase family protein [Lachnospiraceae bacterium]